MNTEGLKKAIDSLSVLDVYMNSSKAYCAKDFDPKRFNVNQLKYQFKHMVTGSQTALFEEELKGQALFKVFIDVGCRFVPQEDADKGKEEPTVLAEIEATMVAEYLLSDVSLDEDSLKVFALENASFHIWPFWREYLTNMCNRMNLPKIAVPTFQVKNQ